MIFKRPDYTLVNQVSQIEECRSEPHGSTYYVKYLFYNSLSIVDTTLILDCQVSFQQNAQSRLSGNFSVRDCIEFIQTGKYGNTIARLRSHLALGQYELYRLNKTRLPGVTFSATFRGTRNRSSIETYNNLLVIDVDKLSPAQLQETKAILENDENVFAFWESPSRAGIKGLIPLDFNIKTGEISINDIHYAAFHQVHAHLLAKYQIEIDTSGSDVTRLCFFSEDKNLHQKKAVTPFLVDLSDLKIKKPPKNQLLKFTIDNKSLKNKKFNPGNRNSPSDRFNIKSITTFLRKRNKSITSSYENWFKVGLAISNTFTFEIGLKYFIELSKLDFQKFNSEQCLEMLEYCYSYSDGSYTFATIVHLAKMEGYKVGKEVPKAELET